MLENERIHKPVREICQVSYKVKHIGPAADFSAETYRPKEDDIFKVLKEKDLKPWLLLYPVKLSLINEGEIKYFLDRRKQRIHHHQMSLKKF